jgi:hypothetical protein
MSNGKKIYLNLIYILTNLMFFGSCTFFEQNDFVVSKTISNEPKETIYYNVYQTGIDNYRLEFNVNYGIETTKLFEYYLNDAVYTSMNLDITKNNDTVKIKINMPTRNISAKTRNKTIVILTKE